MREVEKGYHLYSRFMVIEVLPRVGRTQVMSSKACLAPESRGALSHCIPCSSAHRTSLYRSTGERKLESSSAATERG